MKDENETKVELIKKLKTLRKEREKDVFNNITGYKKAEEMLQKSEKKYRQLVKHAPSGIYEIDYQKGRLVNVNDIFCSYTGYTREELLSMSPLDILTEDSKEHASERRKKILAGEQVPETVEYKIRRKNGQEIWILSNMNFIFENGSLVRSTVIAHDITDRKQVEEKEKGHHKNIQLLSKTAMQFVEFPADKNLYNFIGEQLKELIGKDSYIVVNIFDEETSISMIVAVLGLGKFTDKINKVFGRHLMGMTFNVKDINQHYTDGKMHLYEEGLYGLLLKTIPKTLCKSMEKLLNIEKSYTIDLVKQGQFFGSIIIFLKEGAGELKNKQIIEAFIKQASIAVQRRLAEEAQRQSEEKYRTLYESSRDAIMMLTSGEGFLSGNPAAVKLFGCKDEKEFTSLIPQNLSPRYQPNGTLSFEKDKQMMAIAMEKGSHSFEWTHNRVDGKEFPATVLLTRMELQGRKMLQATVRDITERKRAEMEIRLLQKLTMAISEAQDFETALNITLSLMCEHTGWVMGEVWVLNHKETALEYCLGYYDDRNENNERLRRFIESSKQFTFPQGVGLPGRVWQSMLPEWQNDVASLSEEMYLRAKPSKEAELKAALGVPIISNGQMLTVLVFYMTTPQPEDEHQIKLVSAVATQLGTVILRKKAEEALRESEQQLEGIIDSVTDYMSMIDEHHNIVWANDVAKRLFGPDLIGKKCYAAYHRRDKVCDPCVVARTFADGKIHEHETEVVGADGKKMVFWCTANVAARYEDGRPRLVVEISRDITERKQAKERLKKIMNATIETVSNVIEAKDPYTSGHQRRVSQLAAPLAQELGLAEDKIEGIRIASLIHDIGKIGIPTEILSKPTRLTDIEFSLIRGHSQIGYDILKSIDFSYPIARIVLQHHEKINGSGYPRGLKRDEILLEAKIICVADVVEAMSSHRPYRPALGIDVALEEISKNKGILYDPEVVNVCLKLFKEKEFKFE